MLASVVDPGGREVGRGSGTRRRAQAGSERHLVPVPHVDTIAELNELIAAAMATDDARFIAHRRITVGEHFELEAPARYVRRRLDVRVEAEVIEVLDGATVVARHQRGRKGDEVLSLDHYLDVMVRKPGALVSSTPLARARASGTFTEVHQRLWDQARRRLGDRDGTKALIDVLLGHRTIPAQAIVAGLTRRPGRPHAWPRTPNDRSCPTSGSSPSSSRPRSTRGPNAAGNAASPKHASRGSSGSPTSISTPPRPSTPPPSPRSPPAATSPLVIPSCCSATPAPASPTCSSDGHAACEAGLRVRYVTTAQLVNELAEAADERRLSRLVGRYGRIDLLCLDELGYFQLDTRGSELLFQILTEREEKSSVAVASNLPFSEWGKVIPDARLVAAVIDRVTFNAHIIETGTKSYRLRVTRRRRSTGGAKPDEHPGANPG